MSGWLRSDAIDGMKGRVSVAMLAWAFVVVAGSGGCRRQEPVALRSECMRLEADRIELAQRVELLRLRLDGIEARERELAVREMERTRAERRRDGLVARAVALRAGIEAESARFAELRAGRLRGNREAAAGRAFAVFQGAGGRVYRDVVIQRVSDIGIEFRHASGSARLAAAELTAAQRDAFGLEAELANEALAAERRTAEAYAAWVDRKLARAAPRDSEAGRPATAAVSTAQAWPGFRGSLRDRPRSFGNRSSWPSPAGVRTVWYHVVPVFQPPFRDAGGYRNLRVPSANWSFTPRPPCIPTPVRVLPFPTIP